MINRIIKLSSAQRPEWFLQASLALAAVLAMAPPAARAIAPYSFTELDAQGFDAVQVRDVANGYAVGYGVIPISPPGSALQHAFAWPLDGGARIDISKGFRSDATGVDNQGHISGAVYFRSVLQSNPGYWSNPNATPVDFSGSLNYASANATQGDWLVGEGRRLQAPDPILDSAFVWNVNTMSRTSLAAPSGGGPTYGRDIDGNWVVGNAYLNPDASGSAAAWNISNLASPVAINLHPAGSQYSVTNAIRGDGVVGISQPGGQSFNHAYAWDLSSGVARDLHALLPVSMQAKASSASDVIGPIVIGSIWSQSDALEPVIWNTMTQEVINLRQFLPEGTTFATATAINDKGQIVGDWIKPDGARSIYILTPQVAAGDATFDRLVDTIDFNILAAHFSRANGDWGSGDFDANSTVDTLDFNLLASNFGSTPAGTGVVPEPGAFSTLLVAAAVLARRRREQGQGVIA